MYRTDELGPNATDTLGRALANHLLPTPVAGDGTKASSNPATSNKRLIDGRQAYLTDIVQTELLQSGDEHWIESGSLIGSEVLDLLGTPCANPTVRTKFRSRNPNPAELVELLNESKTPLLKTPLASDDGSLHRPERYLNRNEPGGRFDLSDQVAALLPTPTCSDANGAGPHGDGGPDLRTAVTLLPTPLTSDANTPITHTQPDWERVQLRDIGALLPTPRAQNGESRNQNIYARPLDQPQNLENALALLPTPLTRPSKNGQIWVRPEDEFQNLENAIAHMPSVNALLPTPTVMDMGSNYTPEEWEAWKLKQKEAHRNGNGHGASLTQEAL